MKGLNRNKLPVTVLSISLVIFAMSQLVINSILSPLGIELEDLNTEKESLVEENREMENQIAKLGSIKVIQTLTKEKLEISKNGDQEIIYVNDTDVIAEK
jgi:cell division protein FtsB